MKGNKKKKTFSPSMMIFKYFAGLLVSSFAVTGVGFVDSVIWKVAVFIASTLATTIVGSFYSSEMIKSKVAGGEARIVIFSLLLYICYLIINLIAQFAGTMPLWTFLVIFAIFVVVIGFLGLFVYRKYRERATAIYYTEQDEVEERKKQEEIEKECERDRRLGRGKVVDLTNSDEQQYFTLFELWENKGKEEGQLRVKSSKKSIEFVQVNCGPNEKGKFVGLIKYSNYDEPIKSEILFSNKKIWYI